MNKALSIRDVKIALLEGMCNAFKENGFTFIKQENCFRRNVNDCIQNFYFLFSKSKIGILVEPRWSIKVPAILEVYHKVATKDKQYFKDTSVLENSLGELIEYTDNGNKTGSGKSMGYLIENANDIDILIQVIPNRFRQYVLPYFNANNTINQVEKLLNDNPKELSIHQWLYPLRACLGIIAAKITGSTDIEKLVDVYHRELHDALPSYKSEFEKLRKMLTL